MILFGISVLLFGVSGFLRGRALRRAPGQASEGNERAARAGELPAPKQRAAPAIDDDLADIEAILKKRGIT